jgi:acetyl esterase/lipase
MRWVFLSLAVMLCALSSLTWVPAWHVVVWQAALLAGEFGHYLGLVTVLLVCVIVAYGTVVIEPDQPFWKIGMLAVGFALGAAFFFFTPTGYATRVAQGLPAKMEQAFGQKPESSRPLDLRRMWIPLPRVQPVEASTHTYSPTGWTESLKLDFYPTAAANAPVVIVVHGGGWDNGDRDQIPHFNHWLARAGYNVAAISYRLAPTYPWPAQRDDTLQAIAWLKANATQLDIDATRIVLMGRSAGAQIAGAVAYAANDPAIRGFIGLYGVYDMNFVWSISREDDVLNSIKLMNQFLGGAPTPANQADYDSASAQGLVRTGQTPPTLLLHGTVDTLCWVKHSQRLAEQLKKAAVPHAYIELPWAVHAFDYNLTGPGGQITTYAIETFLDQIL